MLNDYYSVSYLPVTQYDYIEELNIISRVYRSLGIKNIYLSYEFDPTLTAAANVSRSSRFFQAFRRSVCPGVRIIPVYTVTISEGVSNANLSLLAHKTPKGSLLYVKVPVGISRDLIASELHSIIYRHKLIPVFTSLESVMKFSSEQVFDVILSVPNAYYLFSLPHINSSEVRELIKRLLKLKKPVLFGTGTGFDGCPYKNINFYIKQIKRAIGDNRYGFYIYKHNRIFN